MIAESSKNVSNMVNHPRDLLNIVNKMERFNCFLNQNFIFPTEIKFVNMLVIMKFIFISLYYTRK